MTHLSRRTLLRNAGVGAAVAATPLASALPAAALPATAGAPGATAGVAAGPILAHVRPRTAAQLALMARLDDTHTTFDDGAVEVLLHDGDLALLDGVGMDYDLVSPATAEAPIALDDPWPGQKDDYRRSSTEYADDLRALVAAHEATGRVRLLEMPTPSLLGQQVLAVEIATDVANEDGRPVVMHDGMHHCREWPAGEMPMMWAHELLESYDTDANIRLIVDRVRTVIMPLVNPDGFDRTQEAAALIGDADDSGIVGLGLAVAGKGPQHRKNLRAITNEGPLEVTGPVVASTPVGASQPDAYGIDLNRNYPFHWGDERGSSSVPEDQTYRGTAPFSEPETHNVRDLVRSRLPITHITHHTSGRQMLIPWGRNPKEIRSPDWLLMKAIADDMAFGYTAPDGTRFEGNNYEAIQAYGLYPTSGTSRDWGHACTRTIIYTFEHGRSFHDTYNPTIPLMYEENRAAFIRHSLAAMDPTVHARITGEGPVGGTVVVAKTFQTPTNLQISPEDPPVADPTAGILRPTLVDEEIRREVTIGDDGTFEICVPPSTRPFLVNEVQLDGFAVGDHEPYDVTILDADGAVVREVAVTVDRGYEAVLDAGLTEVTAVGPVDTNPTPGA